MKLNKIVLALAALSASAGAFAHGYVAEPTARVFLCTPSQGQQNRDCGSGPMYEPQSVEGFSGFPQAGVGPADGKIASAAVASMARLDEQSDSRWTKVPMSAGKRSFIWNYTAPHVTKDWNYYITKADWNPNRPLTRASFEPTPFCHIDGKGLRPALGRGTPHECNVPQRQGYQVILAVWDVADTAASFYNVIDVNFAGNNPHPGEDVKPVEPVTPTPPVVTPPVVTPPVVTPPVVTPPVVTPPAAPGSVAAWDSTKAYTKPCEKVSYNGNIFENGWWTRGEVPNTSNRWGVWRTTTSAERHAQCK